MRRLLLTLPLALITTTLLTPFALASNVTPDQPEKKTAAPLTSTAVNPVFDYSARKVLGYISETRVALANNQKEDALSNLVEARRELEGISSMRNYLEAMGITFGRVLYGEKSDYYIPVADDTYAVRTYKRGPFWSNDKTMAVRDVEVVNVNIAINPEKATERLNTAEKHIADNKFTAADKELYALLDESIREVTVAHKPFTKLKDNIYITRILIRQENYDGARYTLRNAKKALKEYEKTVTAPDRRTRVAALDKEIDELDDVIKRRDPTLLQKAGGRVEGWWNDLKSWTQDKTS